MQNEPIELSFSSEALELSKPMQGEVKKVSSIAKKVKESIIKHASSTKIKKM